jgi:hypothetical protein
MIANQGEVYDGYIVCVDSIGWIFKDIAISQLKSISEGDGHQGFAPIAIIVNKKDLLESLLKPNIIKDLSQIITQAIRAIKNGMEIRFHNRAFNKSGLYQVRLNDESIIPFTIAEQVIVNAIDFWSKNFEISTLTPMNIRLLVRSFLLGYCVAMKETVDLSKWPMFTSMANPSLANRLNYHRPTAFETGSGWEKLSGTNEKGELNIAEPPILRQAIDEKTVEVILKKYVFVSEKKFQEFVNEMNKLGQIYKWLVTSCIFSNSVEKSGINIIKNGLSGLVKTLEIVKEQKTDNIATISDIDISSMGLDDF